MLFLIMRRLMLIVGVCVSATILHASEAIPRHHQYPDGRTVYFTTWSVFLVCDPTWLQAEGKTDRTTLYNAYLNLVVTANESDAPFGRSGGRVVGGPKRSWAVRSRR